MYLGYHMHCGVLANRALAVAMRMDIRDYMGKEIYLMGGYLHAFCIGHMTTIL